MDYSIGKCTVGKNIQIVEDVVILPLYDRFEDVHNYLFDAEFIELFESRTWKFSGKQLYATFGSKTVGFHRKIMAISSQTECVMHSNGDLLDNRKSNLKIFPRSDVGGKAVPEWFKGGVVAGVSYSRTEYSWRAYFRGTYRRYSVRKYGEFEAARLACKWRVEQMQQAGFFMDEPCMEEVLVAYGEVDAEGNRDLVPFYGEPSLVV
ncbi:AP2/ERF family transcription factor [Cerasicoccus arenae]|uniref:AP2 domain-containing protein n=1 Tax=Cerasicoccus arenae TaxID=424488 RepID=A0A8J3DDZ5_9BACT|nr:AP2/ERF family transcription factor [Cerasicoccus arenae]MBK1860026.1 AP2 domain-containing protein [Cerasicoccus arenae]GHC12562.1 hypothetical protein GCM10007047_32400 [Cerasicoccus arenae]